MMMMKKNLLLSAVAVVAVLLVAASVGPTAEAVTCSASQLTACSASILYGTAPTGTCCSKLKEQKPCLCGYLKDPSLRQYVGSPNAKKLATNCGLPNPKCS